MPEIPKLPPEKWSLVESLFDRLLDGERADVVLVNQSDPEVLHAVNALWANHKGATSENFLGEPITLIRTLASTQGPRFSVGQVLGNRFAIERFLGAGGMGEVYFAQDTRLGEPVAIKTIRSELAMDPEARRRFIAEVQHARKVTHPNVCRINELFDEGNTVFLSMEYLEGPTLSGWMRSAGGAQKAARRRVALQLCEGLWAAHRSGIVHGDFKPGNVIVAGSDAEPRAVITDFGLARASLGPAEGGESAVAAGTRKYMAPELLEGAPAGIATDIYALGRVLTELLPVYGAATRCTAARPEDRPVSLQALVEDLKGNAWPRRSVLVGAAVALASAGYLLRPQAGIALSGRQRLAVNGFRPGKAGLAGTLRDLLVTALRQSPLVMVVADDHLKSLLLSRNFPATLPAERATLEAAAGGEIVLLIEGTLQTVGKGVRLLIEAFQPGSASPALSFTEQANDARQVVRLADQAAVRLRRAFGESAVSLRAGAGYLPLEQVTSASPEAVEAYYTSLREYELARAETALTWLDQAIRLDPQFALAHRQKALVLAAHFQTASSIESYQQAMALRERVPTRERTWIECGFAGMVGDNVAALAAAQRLVTLFPDEAIYQRTVAFNLARLGRPAEALPYSRRAVELDSASDNNVSELIANHTNANRCDEALGLWQQFHDRGRVTTLLHWGKGLAYMGKDEHGEAVRTFQEMGTAPERDRWARMLRCGALILNGKFLEAVSSLEADLAWDIATGEQARRQIRRVWIGMLEWMMDAPARARGQVEELVRLDASPAWLLPLREAAVLALHVGSPELAEEALGKLTVIARDFPSTHSAGAQAHIEGAVADYRGDSRVGELLNRAAGLRNDPMTGYSTALWQMRHRDYPAALVTLERLEEQRGWILRHYFPPLVPLCRLLRAECLARMSRSAEASRLYTQVLEHWGANDRFSLVFRARNAQRDLKA